MFRADDEVLKSPHHSTDRGATATAASPLTEVPTRRPVGRRRLRHADEWTPGRGRSWICWTTRHTRSCQRTAFQTGGQDITAGTRQRGQKDRESTATMVHRPRRATGTATHGCSVIRGATLVTTGISTSHKEDDEDDDDNYYDKTASDVHSQLSFRLWKLTESANRRVTGRDEGTRAVTRCVRRDSVTAGVLSPTRRANPADPPRRQLRARFVEFRLGHRTARDINKAAGAVLTWLVRVRREFLPHVASPLTISIPGASPTARASTPTPVDSTLKRPISHSLLGPR